MDIIRHNVEKTQLPLIKALTKALGISFEKPYNTDDNARQIKEALDRVQSGDAALTTLDWEEFRRMAYGK